MTETLPSRTDLPAPALPAQWNPGEVEAGMYQRWVDAGYFAADASSDKPPYCIVIPPPNVTGSLHLGHAMDHTLIDILTRRRRMQGYDVLWLPGMDHAGIATQNVVERRLAKDEGLSRHDLGREAFVAKVWSWKAESGGTILGQMRRVGDGVDWSRERFTLDEGLSAAVQTIFKRLFDDDLIYRAERIINWCPRCRTALSDIEVDHSDDEGELVSIRYGDGADAIVVATTRVETMLGDTGVAVHPDDDRYAHLVGREIRLPIVDRMIPVVADSHVDPAFGTGAVKVTPAHDPNDFEIGRRHDLPMPSILDEGADVVGTGTRFDGMSRFVAREAVREELRAQGRIVAEKRPYLHSVGHCSRCDTVIEPRLSLQWFVRVAPLARAAAEAVRDGRTTIHPKELEKRYFDWVDNMHDWTISRQLWWGHRIPVWYGPAGEVVCVGPGERPPSGAGWVQDPDVLDTWFSSGLWPFSTLGWPADTADLRRYYPTSVLVTGYDILFFWVVRMMMFGLYAMDGAPPFTDVYLHGLIRDQHGKKMSKSRGNTIDPLELIDEFGADALRFTIARGSNPGADMALSTEWVAASRNFTTKLWNATRFALANGASPHLALPGSPTDADAWILGRLREVREEADALLEDFQFAKATEALFHFTWDELCDWYLELAKAQLADDRTADGTRAVLGHVLDALLRLWHPVVPFVTEALWQALQGAAPGGESVVVASWPSRAGAGTDAGAAARIADVQKLVTEVRRFRTEQGLPDRRRVAARVTGMDAASLGETGPGGAGAALRTLVRLDDPEPGFAPTATIEVALAGGTVLVELDTSGAIDVAAERARLGRDLAAAQKELEQADRKLGNPKFVEKAPAEVVDGIRERHAAAAAEIERVTARLAALPSA
ncbi:MAG: valine--tRNA ligase [Pseudonocardia sp.]